MQHNRLYIIIVILSLLLYGAFCINHGKQSIIDEQKSVNLHANVISESVWTLNPDLAKDYLQLASESEGYKQIIVYSSPGQKFISIHNDTETGMDRFLRNLSLIKTIPLNAKIKHKDEIIGEISAEWHNKSIYNCLYGLLILFLLLTVLWFFIKTLNHEAELKIEVKHRTSELEKEVLDRIATENELIRLTNILENTSDLVSITTPDKCMVYMNKAGREMLGWPPDEPPSGRSVKDNHPQWAYELIKNEGGPQAEKTGTWSGETAVLGPDGTEIPVSQVIISHRSKEGKLEYFSTVMRDISESKKAETERIKLQEQLRHSQKMDAVGQLAGGVAHDFNNLLSAITGCSEVLELKLEDNKKLLEYAKIISSASYQASKLTKTLLAFSRKDHMLKENIDVHESIRKVSGILKRTINKNIIITSMLNAETTIIHGDESLLEASILNLCINARDAMPNGGDLIITTRNVDKLDKTNVLFPEKKHDKYIELRIEDTGAGISPDMVEHVFEPFFTSKEVGKGTGLGLSVVYQTVKENDGSIDLKSKKDKGTTINIFFPVSEKQITSDAKENDQTIIYGKGKILLVDDDSIVREFACNLLEEFGYNVLSANDGKEAIKIYKKQQNTIDLVILDLLMPKMNGKDTFYALKKINPEIKVIIFSGFIKNTNINSLMEDGIYGLIQKPAKAAELSQVISKILTK